MLLLLPVCMLSPENRQLLLLLLLQTCICLGVCELHAGRLHPSVIINRDGGLLLGNNRAAWGQLLLLLLCCTAERLCGKCCCCSGCNVCLRIKLS